MKSENEHSAKKRITLDNIPKRNFQQVPDGYFEQLPSIIQAKIENESGKRTPVFTIGFNWQTAAIAATITLLLVFSGVFKSDNSSQSVEDMLAEIGVEDIIEYLDYSEITTMEIVAELDLDENDIDDFLENDIHLLNNDEFESIKDLDLYQEFGIDENVF